jgi:hypothetical protein
MNKYFDEDDIRIRLLKHISASTSHLTQRDFAAHQFFRELLLHRVGVRVQKRKIMPVRSIYLIAWQTVQFSGVTIVHLRPSVFQSQ